ncbi:MAG: hypothetical protein QOE70_2151 [Chthoniobacter sp.]|jgi:hypothetical protein|nr:hypothetical protein [Chthoniobacter sp.]
MFCFLAFASAATVQTFTGEVFRGMIELDDLVTITPAGGSPVKIQYDRILRLTAEDSATPERVPAGLVLVNGTRIAGAFGPLGGATVRLSQRGLSVAATSVAWIVYSPFALSLAANLVPGKVGALLPGGDFFEGTLKGADAEQCKLLNPIFGLRTFDGRRGELHALIIKDAKPAPVNFEVRTADGSLFRADSLVPEKGGVSLRGTPFETLTLRAGEIVELRAGPARYQPLTQLKPSRIDAPGRFAIDKTLAGEPLRNPEGAEARGIESAVNAAGLWALPAGFTVFTAQVRVAPGVPPINKLAFVVYGDGRPVFRSPAMNSEDPPLTIRATLETARVIALRLEGVFPTNAAGSGIWLEPTLLRR